MICWQARYGCREKQLYTFYAWNNPRFSKGFGRMLIDHRADGPFVSKNNTFYLGPNSFRLKDKTKEPFHTFCLTKEFEKLYPHKKDII